MKPRRDITLGEMQDECKRRNRDCMAHTYCAYRWYCDPILNATEFDSITPLSNDLTDPPRFNEQQMALLKGFYEIGIRAIERVGYAMWSTQGVNGSYVSIVKELGLKENETLDLAELLGKDGAE